MDSYKTVTCLKLGRGYISTEIIQSQGEKVVFHTEKGTMQKNLQLIAYAIKFRREWRENKMDVGRKSTFLFDMITEIL